MGIWGQEMRIWGWNKGDFRLRNVDFGVRLRVWDGMWGFWCERWGF